MRRLASAPTGKVRPALALRLRPLAGGTVPSGSQRLLPLLFGASLNTTLIRGGFNLSWADPICVLLLMVLAVRRELKMQAMATIGFLILSVSVLVVSGFVAPWRYGINPSFLGMSGAYLKLVSLFLYLTVGYSLAGTGTFRVLYRGYAFAAAGIASVGGLMTVLPTSFRIEGMYSFYRFQGMMSDPNYYAVTAIAALPYFLWRIRDGVVGAVGASALLAGVIISGSKTGVVALVATLLVCYVCVRLGDEGGRKSWSFRFMLLLLLLFGGLVVFWSRIVEYLEGLASFDRVSRVFTDFWGATSEGGSSRISTWTDAFSVWADSPLTGVGIGNYGAVTAEVTGATNLAHNTYLQLLAEWGLVPAVALFLLLGYLIFWELGAVRRGVIGAHRATVPILTPFVVGSISLSLNNARFFWVLLGVLLLGIVRLKRDRGLLKAEVTSGFTPPG